MKILFINTYYPNYLSSFYKKQGRLVEKQNYDKKTPTPQLKEKSGLFDKIKGWFSNDDEDSEEISEE